MRKLLAILLLLEALMLSPQGLSAQQVAISYAGKLSHSGWLETVGFSRITELKLSLFTWKEGDYPFKVCSRDTLSL